MYRDVRFMSTCLSELRLLQCPCCLATQQPGQEDWHNLCQVCGYQSARFTNAINSPHATISESHREDGLQALRESNFRSLLEMMEPFRSAQRQSLLEVGCGHCWFLQLAAGRFAALGIEPDTQIFQSAKAKGLNVARRQLEQNLAYRHGQNRKRSQDYLDECQGWLS